MKAKTFQTFFILHFAFCIGVMGQTRVAVMVTNTTGALAAPTNFFAANSNALNAAVNNSHGSGGGGGNSNYFQAGAGIAVSQISGASGITNTISAVVTNINAANISNAIFASKTIVVAPSGGDFTDVQSAINALPILFGSNVVNSLSVTIQIADGTYNVPAAIENDSPFAKYVYITGAHSYTHALTGVVSSSGGAGGWTLALSCDSAANVAAGDYVIISGASGGVNPTYLAGVFPVTGVSGSQITVTSTHAAGSPPAGAVTGTITDLKTILKYSGTDGFRCWNQSVLNLDRVVLVGNGSGWGISLQDVSRLYVTSALAAYGFQYGFVVNYNSQMNSGGLVAAGANSLAGLQMEQGGVCDLMTAVANGNGWGFESWGGWLGLSYGGATGNTNDGFRAGQGGQVQQEWGSIFSTGNGAYGVETVDSGIINTNTFTFANNAVGDYFFAPLNPATMAASVTALGSNGTNYAAQTAAAAASSLGLTVTNTFETQTASAIMGTAITNALATQGTTTTNVFQTQSAAATMGAAITNALATQGTTMTNGFETQAAAVTMGTAMTNALQAGTNALNLGQYESTSAAGVLSTNATNYALAQAAAAETYAVGLTNALNLSQYETAAAAGAMGTALTNYANAHGGANFNPAQFDTNTGNQVEMKSGARMTNATLYQPTFYGPYTTASGTNYGNFYSGGFNTLAGDFSAGERGISFTQTPSYDNVFPLDLTLDSGSTVEAFHINANGTADLEAFMGTNQSGATSANYVWQLDADGRLNMIGLAQPSGYIAPAGAATFDVAGIGSQTNSQRYLAVNCSNGSVIVEYPALQGGWVKGNGSIFGASNSVVYEGTRVDTVDNNTLCLCALGHPLWDLNGRTNACIPPGASWRAWSDGTNVWYSITHPTPTAAVAGQSLLYLGAGQWGLSTFQQTSSSASTLTNLFANAGSYGTNGPASQGTNYALNFSSTNMPTIYAAGNVAFNAFSGGPGTLGCRIFNVSGLPILITWPTNVLTLSTNLATGDKVAVYGTNYGVNLTNTASGRAYFLTFRFDPPLGSWTNMAMNLGPSLNN